MKRTQFIVLAFIFICLHGTAQEKTPSDGKVGKTVNKVGNKTAKIAVKTTSAVVDKKYEGKTGPEGQTVFINKKDQYYYVNGKGKKIYLTKAQLKDKEK